MPAEQVKSTRIRLKNILFATDFSAVSELALPYVKALARRYESTVLVAHVYPPELTYEIPIDLPPDYRHNRASAEARMRTFLQAHDLTTIPHELTLQSGDVWLVLSEIIEQKGVDLVVLGTHGRKGLMNLLLGSVAEQVIRCAPCPVLTVGPDTSLTAITSTGDFRHIVYATNFSPASERALAYALSLAQESQARLTMLHVVEEPAVETSMDFAVPAFDRTGARCAVARERLRAMLPAGVDFWCEPELLVQIGASVDRILDTAKARNADLIVMGAHHSRVPQASAHAPWRTVHRIVCEAHCPVLTVRN